MNQIHRYVMSICTAAVSTHALAGDTAYETSEVPTLSGHPFALTTDINNHGHVIGSAHTCPFTISCLGRGFLWDGETLTDISDPVLEFVPPGHVGFVTPFKLNDNGDVAVRLAIPDVGGFSVHYLDGEATLITPFPGAVQIQVSGINELGQIVGAAGDPSLAVPPLFIPPNKGFVWDAASGETALVIEAPKGFTNTYAQGINDAGVVVGGVGTASGSSGRGFILDDGRMTLLQPLAGDVRSSASDINNEGFIVGVSTDANSRDRTVIWTLDGSVHAVLDLEQYDDVLMSIWEINSSNQVVGYYWPIYDALQYFAFVWSPDDGFYDLNNSIPKESIIDMWEATGINEAGQIASWGDSPGFIGGFIFTPDGTSTPGDLDDDGDVDFADLLALLAAWGECVTGPACPEDLDNSGDVGFVDLLILLANWT